jgi:Mrp family chromosome partitioning ATPase
VSEQRAPSVIDSLWRFRGGSAAIVLVTVLLSVAAALAVAPGARATGTIALTTPRENSVLSAGSLGDASLARYTAQRARFVTSDTVMEAVAARLGLTDITALRRRVSVTPSNTSNILTITAEGDTGDEAVALAAAVIETYAAETQADVAQRTERAISTIRETQEEITGGLADGSTEAPAAAETLSVLELQASELATDAELFGDGVEFVTAPRPEAVATAGPPLREFGLGLVLGLVIAATVAWLRADRDRGVTTSLQPEAILDAPLLGELRARGDVVLQVRPDLARMPSRDFQIVWSSLHRLVRQESARVLLVSATGNAPHSSTALNVAVAAARDGLRVLLVDADVERAAMTGALGVPTGHAGVSDLLQRDLEVSRVAFTVQVGGDRTLSVLPAGTAATDVTVATPIVERAVANWRDQFDLVVIDAAPVGNGQLSAVLAGVVDGLLVAIAKGSDERPLHELRRRISLYGTPVMGYVFAAPAARRLRRRFPEPATAT